MTRTAAPRKTAATGKRVPSVRSAPRKAAAKGRAAAAGQAPALRKVATGKAPAPRKASGQRAAPSKAAPRSPRPGPAARSASTRLAPPPAPRPRRSSGRRPPARRPPRRPLLPRAKIGDPNRRLRVALVLALAVLSLFAGRLVQLQGLDAKGLALQALAQRSVKVSLPAHRGDILDSTGAVLATTVERRNITVDQRVVPCYGHTDAGDCTPSGVPQAAQEMAPLLGMTPAAVAKKLTGTRSYAIVAKDVEPEVWRKIARLAIPGVYAEQASRRLYPEGSVAASVVGFTGKDGTPLAGIERAQRSVLAGTDGSLRYERGRGGTEIPTGLTAEVDPVPGRTVQLTLDRDLQWKTQQALAAAVEQTQAQAGYAIVLDPRTGDVLSLANVPTFDANNPGASPADSRGNGALTDVFEPGSTSKVITAAAALEEGVVRPDTHVEVPSLLRRGGKTFHDAESHGTEKLTFAGVLAKSSNMGTIMAGEQVPPATMYRYLRGFGIGQKTGVGLPESPGILDGSEDWSRSQRYTVLFGQGLSVTALQAAEVFATIANDGVRVSPRLVKAVADAQGSLRPTSAAPRTRVISAQTAATLRLMLESVVGDSGTARKAVVPGYRVAGKTGTAQAYDSRCACYRGYTASFIGMAPADNPKLVVAVVLQQPVRGHFGGQVAAPVFQQVMTYALASRGVTPTGTKAPDVPLTYP